MLDESANLVSGDAQSPPWQQPTENYAPLPPLQLSTQLFTQYPGSSAAPQPHFQQHILHAGGHQHLSPLPPLSPPSPPMTPPSPFDAAGAGAGTATEDPNKARIIACRWLALVDRGTLMFALLAPVRVTA